MHDDDRVLDDARREAWPAAEPPPDFAERVLAARRAELAAAPRRWQLGFVAAAAAAVVAAGAALFFALRPPAAETGSLITQLRSELPIGARAVAVAEAGAALAWRVGGGEARVEQTRGDVFYRVERGGRFVVATPAGEVIVSGTCFRVEVIDMKIGKQAFIGAGAGALVTAAVMVTVYEGRVALANDKGTTEVRAGERATAGGGAAPGPAVVTRSAKPAGEEVVVAPPPPPAADATREQLLARDAQQRKEIADLRAQLAAMPAREGGGHRMRAVETKSFLQPTRDELLEMARTCTVQFDAPDLSSAPLEISPRSAEQLGLGADDIAATGRVRDEVTRRTLAQLRAIYAEITGNTTVAEDLTVEGLLREIEDKIGRHEGTEAARQLSQERAGLAAPPENLATRPPGERAMRIMSSVGDVMERELAKAVGPEKARALRGANDGWSTKARVSGCLGGGGEGQAETDEVETAGPQR